MNLIVEGRKPNYQLDKRASSHENTLDVKRAAER